MEMVGLTGDVEEVRATVARIMPLLAGRKPEVQGAVLADLLAMWLAGHHVENDAEATRKMRAELLDLHCCAVRKLTTFNAKVIGTTGS